MVKLKMHSPNKVDENIEKIGKLFPDCVTERKNEKGETEYGIDFDVLRQELSDVVIEGNEERYQFTWPDKKKSILLANAPIAKTLRPCREESVDFENTENLYIEGDNLDVLKLLQETYLGKVKMIYIDPPYNTGNDFVYEDDFAQNTNEYLANSGQYDEEGNRLVKNLDSNGRFHTDWLNMIYPRLKLAKDLLTDDGVIFISIDDNEVENLKKICNEIFGALNFLSQIIWKKRSTPPNDRVIGAAHEYILVYAKYSEKVNLNLRERTYEQLARYRNPDKHPKGPWMPGDLGANIKGGRYVPSLNYPIVNPTTGDKHYPPQNGNWRFNADKINQLLNNDEIYFGEDGAGRPKLKRFLCDVKQGITYTSLWDFVPFNTQGSAEMTSLLGNISIFDNPKPVGLIHELCKLGGNKEDIFLDFFSGSATAAHAVMRLNSEDGGKRKFIMVQLPEETDEKSEAYKAGYKNICEIGKERIRRAGEKIRNEKLGMSNEAEEIRNEKLGMRNEAEEIRNEKLGMSNSEVDSSLFTPHSSLTSDSSLHADSSLLTSNLSLDVGFRVLKCDSTNMKNVYYNPAEYDPDLFNNLTDNIKEDRTPEDLLFQVMLDLGILLSSKIEESVIAGKKVFNVADNYLIACFDDDVTDETVKAIAQKKPYYAAFRDSSMESDSVATNFEQIFKTYSPTTVRKVM